MPPLYQYICPNNHKHEKLRFIADRDKKIECPDCGKQMKREVSEGTGVEFKGQGFYQTDYKK